MRITLLDAGSVRQHLIAMIEKHDHVSVAVAWGQLTDVAHALLARKARIDTVLVGLDFSATDPDLIDHLIGVRGAFVAKNRSGCFHPKIYYFTTGTKAEAIVGSANFTEGGLGRNLEASVHVEGDLEDPFFAQIRDHFEAYMPLRLPITKKLARSYRRQAEAARSLPRPRNPTLPDEPKDFERFNAPLATMSWAKFAAAARADRHHDFGKRIRLLRNVQQMFARTASFADLDLPEWKAIAGVLGNGGAVDAGLEDVEWGWFGSMGGAAVFAGMIGERDAGLAAAMDLIPARGAVTEEHFEAFVRSFTSAFTGRPRVARLAPASRLLAMKRPDIFVCVNGENRRGLARALAFAPTTLALANYWDRVVEPIRQAPWYTTPRPEGKDMELWDARVAMLDAIYYDPSH